MELKTLAKQIQDLEKEKYKFFLKPFREDSGYTDTVAKQIKLICAFVKEAVKDPDGFLSEFSTEYFENPEGCDANDEIVVKNKDGSHAFSFYLGYVIDENRNGRQTMFEFLKIEADKAHFDYNKKAVSYRPLLEKDIPEKNKELISANLDRCEYMIKSLSVIPDGIYRVGPSGHVYKTEHDLGIQIEISGDYDKTFQNKSPLSCDICGVRLQFMKLFPREIAKMRVGGLSARQIKEIFEKTPYYLDLPRYVYNPKGDSVGGCVFYALAALDKYPELAPDIMKACEKEDKRVFELKEDHGVAFDEEISSEVSRNLELIINECKRAINFDIAHDNNRTGGRHGNDDEPEL